MRLSEYDICDLHARLGLGLSFTRLIWLVNFLAIILSVWCHRYDITLLAIFTWLCSLVASAIIHKACHSLEPDKHPAQTPAEEHSEAF